MSEINEPDFISNSMVNIPLIIITKPSSKKDSKGLTIQKSESIDQLNIQSQTLEPSLKHQTSQIQRSRNAFKNSNDIQSLKLEAQITRASNVSRVSTLGISDKSSTLFDFDNNGLNLDTDNMFSSSNMSSPMQMNKNDSISFNSPTLIEKLSFNLN